MNTQAKVFFGEEFNEKLEYHTKALPLVELNVSEEAIRKQQNFERKIQKQLDSKKELSAVTKFLIDILKAFGHLSR